MSACMEIIREGRAIEIILAGGNETMICTISLLGKWRKVNPV